MMTHFTVAITALLYPRIKRLARSSGRYFMPDGADELELAPERPIQDLIASAAIKYRHFQPCEVSHKRKHHHAQYYETLLPRPRGGGSLGLYLRSGSRNRRLALASMRLGRGLPSLDSPHIAISVWH
jgi:hypothetical protein